jgi:hypothetical protein
MSSRTKQDYFVILRERYRKAESKSQRSQIVEEAIANTGLHRKSVLRALNQKRSPDGGPPRLGRPRGYSKSCEEWLKRFCRKSEYACSDKLKIMLPILIKQWRGPIDVQVIEELHRISPASIDRYLKQYRGLERRRRNTGTRPGSLLFKQQIPLKSIGTTAPRPGYLQADTVAHGGETTAGNFAWSLTLTDERVGWTENRSCLGKHAKTVLPQLQSAHLALPFDLIAINVDNGTEFLNSRIVEYFKYLAENKVIPFPMTRSRSYRKNDNCHVEQKNWTTVRQLFGYDRIEHEELIPMMNEIYRVQNLISNYFIPQYKLKSKQRVGAKIKKTYDTPKTPYQRVLDEPSVPEENKRKLREIYITLNYYDLLSEREELLARFEQRKKELDSKKVG